MRGRALIVGFGLTTVCCAPLMAPLASPRHLTVYHAQGPASTLFLPVLIYFAAFWVFLSAILIAGQRFERVRMALWTAVLCSLPWFAVKSVAVLEGQIVPTPWNRALLATSFVAFLGGVLAVRRGSYVRLERHLRAVELFFSFAAFSGLVFLAQFLWCFYAARNLVQPDHLRAGPPVAAAGQDVKPRVVWVILDELSYAQTFERRYPGLNLPEFDRLAGQSAVFTHVVPAGAYTEKVMPSLITGLPVRRISASANGRELTLQTGRRGETRVFDQHDTVFADALLAGYSTGVVGWYNPYCRIMPDVLDHCVWVPHHDRLPGGFRTDVTLGRDLLAPILVAERFGMRILEPHNPAAWTDRKATDEHIGEYRELAQNAYRMLADGSTDFMLLHMAVPHPEGIYDASTNTFTDEGDSSYVDNLALADRTLAHMEDEMRRLGLWDSAAVIVMGDHSWRTQSMWRSMSGWTAEDEAASHGGRFDDRPAYIVKLPGQQVGTRIDKRFEAIRTRALLDAILRGNIRTPDQLAKWAAPGSQK